MLSSLWRLGFLRLSVSQILRLVYSWWLYKPGYAFLARVAAIRWGSHLALSDEKGALSFTELHEKSLALAAYLLFQHGVKPSSRVALIAKNDRDFVLAMLALSRLGAHILPLGPHLPLKVLQGHLQRQNIDTILTPAELKAFTSETDQQWLTLPKTIPVPTGELPRSHGGGELIVLTSGSSGVSKGIRRNPKLSEVMPIFSTLLQALPLKLHQPVILAIPLYHGYGLAALAMSLALGSPLHLRQHYDIAPMLQNIPFKAPPFLISIPTLLKRWLDTPTPEPHRTFQAIITGSAPLPPDLCRELCVRLGPILYNLYGSTEGGLIALATPSVLAQAPGCVGLALQSNQVRLIDSKGQASKMGQILVKGPFALPSQPDGWRATGDLGSFDSYGYLHVHGRIDSMIVSGGENVYPHEVENMLRQHPDVNDCATLAVSDSEFGQRLVAVLEEPPHKSLDLASVRAWLKERLERYKIPKDMIVVPCLPRNALGKIDQNELRRQIGWSESSNDTNR